MIARFSNCGYNTALPDGAWRSPASALAWGARGPGFNSRRPDTRDFTSVESLRLVLGFPARGISPSWRLDWRDFTSVESLRLVLGFPARGISPSWRLDWRDFTSVESLRLVLGFPARGISPSWRPDTRDSTSVESLRFSPGFPREGDFTFLAPRHRRLQEIGVF